MATTPTRPGARRPSAGGPPSQAGKQQRTAMSIEEVRALPEFEEGSDNLDLNPALSSDGGLGAGEGTTVTVAEAHFGRFEYPGRDDIAPELRLFLSLQREGFDSARVESLKYGDFTKFVASKDGMFVKPRAAAIKTNKDGSKYVPRPFKYSNAVMFLQSLTDAGLAVDTLNAKGLAALTGLTLHVRKRKVTGQNEDAKPALVVEYIEGTSSPGAAPKTTAASKPAGTKGKETAAAPAAEVAKAAAASADAGSVDISPLAEEALLDLLTAAPGNTITRAQIPTTLIQSAKWSKHENRGAILKLLRENDFIVREDAPWVVTDNSISLQ